MSSAAITRIPDSFSENGKAEARIASPKTNFESIFKIELRGKAIFRAAIINIYPIIVFLKMEIFIGLTAWMIFFSNLEESLPISSQAENCIVR